MCIFEFSSEDYKKIVMMQNKYLFPCIFHYYKEPLVIVKGEGAIVQDIQEKKYIDAFSGVCTVLMGHGNKKIKEYLKKQMEMIIHTSTLYINIPQVFLAKYLSEMFPNEKTARCYFVNSGSEANEMAIYTSRRFTNRFPIIALHGSYHGRTSLTMEITLQHSWNRHLRDSSVVPIPNAYCYRCPMKLEYPDCGVACADYLNYVLKCLPSETPSALIAEPIQGNGGVIVPPKDYFRILKEICNENDILFISDEVQTGFGRTGGKIWGIEHWNVSPDIITCAKGIASGIPIGAVIARDDVASSIEKKEMFSTFGGNPLVCAGALANVIMVKELKIECEVEKKGKIFEKRMKEVEEIEFVGEYRGMGLMWGIEIVEDKKSKKPSPEKLLEFVDKCREKGLLVGIGGIYSNVVRIKPPLIISEDELNRCADIIADVLKEMERDDAH